MSVLRGLRMRQAAKRLISEHRTVDQIAHAAGYERIYCALESR